MASRPPLRVVRYSDKAIAVLGDSRAIKGQLQAIGGKWNARLTVDGSPAMGWIFRAGLISEVQACIAAHVGAGAPAATVVFAAARPGPVEAPTPGEASQPPVAPSAAVAAPPARPSAPTTLSTLQDGRAEPVAAANTATAGQKRSRDEPQPEPYGAAATVAATEGRYQFLDRDSDAGVFFSEGVGTGGASSAAESPALPTACEDCGTVAARPGLALAYCNRRFRTGAGPPLTAKEVLSERMKLAQDEADARHNDAFFRELLTQTLYGEVLARQRVRRIKDATRGVDHCAVVVCSRCLASPHHTCRSATAVSGAGAAAAPAVGAGLPQLPRPRLSLPPAQVAWTAVCVIDGDEDGSGGLSMQDRWAALVNACVLFGAPTDEELTHPREGDEGTPCVCDASEPLCCFRRARTGGRGKATASTAAAAASAPEEGALVYPSPHGTKVVIRAARVRQDGDDPSGACDRIQFVDAAVEARKGKPAEQRHPTVWPQEVSVAFLRRLSLEQWRAVLGFRDYGGKLVNALHAFVRRDAFAVRAFPPAGRRRDWSCAGGGGFALQRDAPPGRAYLRVGDGAAATTAAVALGAVADEAGRLFIAEGTPVAPFARLLPDYFDWDALDPAAPPLPPPPTEEPEYRCLAVLRYAMSGRSGDQCSITSGLDEWGFCASHGNRTESSRANWRMLDAAVPRFRPPQDSMVEYVAHLEREKKRKTAAEGKAARTDAFRAAVGALLPSPSCDGALESALFDELAAGFLSAPSSVRKRSAEEVAAALQRGWEAVRATRLDQPAPAEDAPLFFLRRDGGPRAAASHFEPVRLATAHADVFVSALLDGPLTTRLRITSDHAWRDHFRSLCRAELVGVAGVDADRLANAAWYARGGPSAVMTSPAWKDALPDRFPGVSWYKFADDALARAALAQPAPGAAELAASHARAAFAVESIRTAMAEAAKGVVAACEADAATARARAAAAAGQAVASIVCSESASVDAALPVLQPQ